MTSMLTWDVDTTFESAGEGEPVVFIHGSTLDMRAWTPQWRVFGRAARVIRYDLRGHGESSSPKTPYSAENYDLQLRTLLDALRISRATLIGHSFGASIALQFALRRPTRVSALVLSNPSVWGAPIPEGSIYTGREHPRFDPGIVYDPRDVKEALRTWLECGVFEATKRNEAAFSTVESIVLSHKGGPWGENARAEYPNLFERLGEILVPTLVVSGENEDPYYQAAARGVGERITGARVVTFPGSGHVTAVEKPTDFNRRVLDFLEPLGITRHVPAGGEVPPKPRVRIRREDEEPAAPEREEAPPRTPAERERPEPARAEEPRRNGGGGDRGRDDRRRRGGRGREGGGRDRREDGGGRGGADRSRREARGGERRGREDREDRGGERGRGGRPGEGAGRGRDDRSGRGEGGGRGGGRGRGRGRSERQEQDAGRSGKDRGGRSGGEGRGRGGGRGREDRGGRSEGDGRSRGRGRGGRDDRPSGDRPPQGKRPDRPKTPPSPKPDPKPKKKGWRDWFGFGKKKKDEE